MNKNKVIMTRKTESILKSLVIATNILISLYLIPVILRVLFFDLTESVWPCFVYVGGVILFVLGYFVQFVLAFQKSSKQKYLFSIISYAAVFLLTCLRITFYFVVFDDVTIWLPIALTFSIIDLSTTYIFVVTIVVIINIIVLFNLVSAIAITHLKIYKELEVCPFKRIDTKYKKVKFSIATLSSVFNFIIIFFVMAIFSYKERRHVDIVCGNITFNNQYHQLFSWIFFVFVILFYLSCVFLLSAFLNEDKKYFKKISLILEIIFCLFNSFILIMFFVLLSNFTGESDETKMLHLKMLCLVPFFTLSHLVLITHIVFSFIDIKKTKNN